MLGKELQVRRAVAVRTAERSYNMRQQTKTDLDYEMLLIT